MKKIYLLLLLFSVFLNKAMALVDIFPLDNIPRELSSYKELLDIENLSWKPEPFHKQRMAPSKGDLYPLKMEEVVPFVLENSFESRLQYEVLGQSYIKIFEKASAMLPQLKVSITKTGPSFGNSFWSLFGVFVPTNWFELVSSKKAYRFELFSMASLLFTHYSMVEQVEIELHLLKTNLEIVKHYLGLLKLVSEMAKEDQIQKNIYDVPLLEGGYYILNGLAFNITYQIYELLSQFSLTLGLTDFSKIYDFKEQKGRSLDIFPLEEKDFFKTVLSRSFELKSLDCLIEERNMVLWGRSLSFFSFEDGPTISIGGNYFTDFLMTKRDINILKIKKEKMISEIKVNILQIIYDIEKTRSIKSVAKEGSRLLHETVIKKIQEYRGSSYENKDISGLLYLIDLLVRNQISYNESRHHLMILNSRYQRLTTSHYAFMTITLSKSKRLKFISDFLKKESKKRIFHRDAYGKCPLF